MKAVFVLVLLIVFLVACEKKPESPSYSEMTQKAQAEAVKAQAEARAADDRRLEGIQMAVITECSKRGMIPVVINGNVDCHK